MATVLTVDAAAILEPAANSAAVATARARPAEPERRIEIIDALRGLALLGILQVNIQSFTWGTGDVLGYLQQPPGTAESVLYFLQAAFLEGKFYPIFAFLFGLGMALQLRNLQRQGRMDARAARAIYRRRLFFLLVLGVLHGLLLYFGDVLAAYALCALIFLELAPVRTRALVGLAWASALAAFLSLFAPFLLESLLDANLASEGGAGADIDSVADAIGAVHVIYSQAGFLVQLQQRLSDEFWQQIGSVISFWPQVLALYALGALAGRLGWLRDPERHPQVWRRALWLGLGIGLPCALLGAAMDLSSARTVPGSTNDWGSVAASVGSLLAAAYVALALKMLLHARARRLRQSLACAGRLSLSNYLLQSLGMGALLSGWGYGLGASATRGQLAVLGLVLFGLQLLWSRWWLAHHRQGPMEALWRRWTYGG